MNRAWLIPLLAVLLAGCSATNSSAPGSQAAHPTADTNTPSTWQRPPPGGELFDVTIAKGRVTPANATWHAKAGQPIMVRVNSDAPDELHVGSAPDHEYEVAAASNQAFTFSVDNPGAVEIDLHHLDKTIATLKVGQ